MIVTHPVWLALAVPLAAALWLWRMPTRWLLGLRIALTVLIVVAAAGPAVRLPSRAGTVVVVADRSLSMPPGTDAAQAEAVDLVQAEARPGDRLAVVAFGREAAVELAPESGRFGGFTTELDRDGSNLAAALDTAANLVPPGAPGRLLVLSDGRATGGNPAAAAARAAGRDLPIDVRLAERPAAGDLAIDRVQAPGRVLAGESYMLTAWVRSPVPQTVQYELWRGDVRVAAGARDLGSGTSRLTFRDRAGAGGVAPYRLTVTGAGNDPVPENNAARLLVGVRGPKPVLLATRAVETGSGRSAFADLLRRGGLEVEARPPRHCRWGLADLAKWTAVLVENVPAGDIGTAGMANLAAWVRETGGGLMLTGGQSAYGPGGYFRSPLEPVMPVSMELRREHRKVPLAIVVALDRSGSMAMSVPGGRTKMDLANLATSEVVGLLSPMDAFGCVAVDSEAHTIVNLAPLDDALTVQSRVRKIDSMGGGIFIYEALSAAARMLLQTDAPVRHILLFADAADSEEPGAYKDLLAKCREAGITVTVIGLGTPSDADAGLLRDIAKRGEGRCLFTTRASELPRLFAQDTFIVARSAFVDEPAPVRPTPAMLTLTGRAFNPFAPVGGYNLCYVRPGAELAALTADDRTAPVIAAWQAGTGRVLCYTGEADGPHAGAVAEWDLAGELFTSLVRWTAGRPDELPEGMVLRQETDLGRARIALDLDPRGETLPFDAVPRVVTVRDHGAAEPTVERRRMGWASPEALALEVPLGAGETAVSAVEVPGVGRFTLPPTCAPYSAEYAPRPADGGKRTLRQLARATGGRERLSAVGVWDDLARRPRYVDLAPWLLLAAAVVLLVEVFERRTGLISAGFGSGAARVRARADHVAERRGRVRHATPARQEPLGTDAPEPARGPEAPPVPGTARDPSAKTRPGGALADALREARQRARRRTGGPPDQRS